MLIRGVVDHELGDDPQPAAMRLGDEEPEVLPGAVLRVDVVVVGNVIPVILAGGRIKRQQPDGIHPELLDVIQLLGEPREIAYAVIVGVEKRSDVHLINNSVLVPKRITCRLLIPLCVHAVPSSIRLKSPAMVY